jgi:hypothetical protein
MLFVRTAGPAGIALATGAAAAIPAPALAALHVSVVLPSLIALTAAITAAAV